MVVPLPRNPSIKAVLQMYSNETKEVSGVEYANAMELIEGILYFFNIAIETTILYPSEYPQYKLVQGHKFNNNCEVYGVEHLLRLLFQLPTLYSSSDFSDKDLVTIRNTIDNLLIFLMKHRDLFLNYSQYVTEKESVMDL